MSFRPNVTGPTCSMGRLVVAAAGTGILLNDNWEPKMDYAAVTPTVPNQYCLSCADIIVTPASTNLGGLFVVSKNALTGSKSEAGTVLLYIPKGSGPVHLAQSLGSNRFCPALLALDADQDGDGADVSGVIL